MPESAPSQFILCRNSGICWATCIPVYGNSVIQTYCKNLFVPVLLYCGISFCTSLVLNNSVTIPWLFFTKLCHSMTRMSSFDQKHNVQVIHNFWTRNNSWSGSNFFSFLSKNLCYFILFRIPWLLTYNNTNFKKFHDFSKPLNSYFNFYDFSIASGFNPSIYLLGDSINCVKKWKPINN